MRFKDLTPIRDGEYGNITIGRHVSIFIGGVVHELGHALSLPHCRQRADEAVRGTALMGSGNRTFRQETRGEGRGTFLTQAHALRLAAHPVFMQKVTSRLAQRPQVDTKDLRIDVAEQNAIRVSGRFTSNIPIHGIVAYFDPAGGGDYDARTATAVPDDAGRFQLQCDDLPRNRNGQLRVLTCHVNGATRQRSFDYSVDKQGRPEISAIRLKLELSAVIQALREKNIDKAERELKTIAGDDGELMKIGNRVIDRFKSRGGVPPASVDPSKVSDTTTSISLSQVKPTIQSVGWLKPMYDGVPDDARLLSAAGDFFASGIYAHAPARHSYQLGKQWKRFKSTVALQNGHPGSVGFEVVGDGRLLWQRNALGPVIPHSLTLMYPASLIWR